MLSEIESRFEVQITGSTLNQVATIGQLAVLVDHLTASPEKKLGQTRA